MDKPLIINRRRLFGATAATVAAGSLGLLLSDRSEAVSSLANLRGIDESSVRPFRVAVPEAQLVELRRRIKATRWPERETVADASQGVQLATTQALARHWATDYDWRK